MNLQIEVYMVISTNFGRDQYYSHEAVSNIETCSFLVGELATPSFLGRLL